MPGISGEIGFRYVFRIECSAFRVPRSKLRVPRSRIKVLIVV